MSTPASSQVAAEMGNGCIEIDVRGPKKPGCAAGIVAMTASSPFRYGPMGKPRPLPF